MHGEQRSVPRSFNKTALIAAGGTPPSGPHIALGVSRDYEFQSSDGGGESRPALKKQRIGKSTVYQGRKTWAAAAGRKAGIAPSPSDSIYPSGSPDIRELAAFVFVDVFCIWVAVTMVILTHIPFFEVFDLG